MPLTIIYTTSVVARGPNIYCNWYLIVLLYLEYRLRTDAATTSGAHDLAHDAGVPGHWSRLRIR